MKSAKQGLKTLSSLIVVIAALSSQPAQARGGRDPLEGRLNGVPLDLQSIALSRALEYLTTFADTDFLLFGVEVETIEGKEPLVSAHIGGNETIREALIELTAKAPEYSFEAVGPHLINVFPAAAKSTPDDLLNLKAGGVRLGHVVVTNFLGHPDRFIPELRVELSHKRAPGCAMGVWPVDVGPEIDLNLRAGTVREQLNEASELSASLAEKGKARAYGWAYFHELLPSAALPEHQWRALASRNPAQLSKRAAPK